AATRREALRKGLEKLFRNASFCIDKALAGDAELQQVECDKLETSRTANRAMPQDQEHLLQSIAALAASLDLEPKHQEVWRPEDPPEPPQYKRDPLPQTPERQRYLAYKSEMALRGEKLAKDF
ncbi:MAG: hypothetical protein GX595_11165, partial [Lentisphaerae bacterium]|nr:hypothetical protein [Lentisphaerota bacterium]